MSEGSDFKTADAILKGRIDVVVEQNKSTFRALKGISSQLVNLGMSIESSRNDINLMNQRASKVEFRVDSIEKIVQNHEVQMELIEEDILKFKTILKFLIAIVTIVGVPVFLHILSNAIKIISEQA
jgi:hypothetical protein